METFESWLCALVPLPRSPSIHQTWFSIKWLMGFTCWLLDHCLPRVAQERMRRVHGRTWGDPRLVMLVRLVISLYKRMQNTSTKQGKLPSRKCDFSANITPLRRVMFAINTTTTSRRVCFNPKRTEKPCALGFSVRFGLKHTLRCVIWVKSWKLEALIWAGSGVIF